MNREAFGGEAGRRKGNLASLGKRREMGVGASRPAVYRIFYMAQLLREGRMKSARLTAQRLQVDEKTIHRDLEFMQDLLGMELAYDAQTRSWRLVKEWRLPDPVLADYPEEER